MSAVSGVQSNTVPTPTSASGALTGKQVMGKEEFLKLLVTQLKNQDPTNPMDGQQFAAQLAQFSSVEQLINIEKGITTQSQNQGLLAQSMNSGLAAGLIGKHVVAESDQLYYAGSGNQPLQFKLESAAAGTTITIYDAAGGVVREMEVGSLPAGTQSNVSWDGKNAAGKTVPPGTYTFGVKAADAAGAPIGAQPMADGKVDRVTFGPEGTLLWFGNRSVPMSAVTTIDAQ